VARLTLAELNRATLARQGLLERAAAQPYDVVHRLAGLQSQAPGPPYTALWSRVRGFAFAELEALLTSREVVRIVTLRGTVHLHTADDARRLRPFTQELIERQFRGNHRKRIDGFDEVAANALLRERLAGGPATGSELAAALATRWPGAPAEALTAAARCLLPLVQIPPRGLWGQSAPPTYALLDEWIGHPLVAPSAAEIVRRYLAAFGPATVKDAQAWCGVTRLAAAFTALADELVEFEGPGSERLYDLVDAPRPPADAPAPVRILAEWDNLLIGYADRSRVIDEAHRRQIFTANGIMPATVLIDGRVAATLRITPPTGVRSGGAAVAPLLPIAPPVRGEIEVEVAGLLTAMGSGDPEVRFADA
jgi:hypothetical protein